MHELAIQLLVCVTDVVRRLKHFLQVLYDAFADAAY